MEGVNRAVADGHGSESNRYFLKQRSPSTILLKGVWGEGRAAWLRYIIRIVRVGPEEQEKTYRS